MPGAAERITLPMSGIEVVVRRGDIDAIMQDGMKFALNTEAMQDVAQAWAKTATEETKEEGVPERPQGQLTAAQLLEISQKTEAAVFRAVVTAPLLDDLMARYGGNDSLPDFGMGPDYGVLKEVVNRLNPAPDKEQAKSPGAGVPAPQGRAARKPR